MSLEAFAVWTTVFVTLVWVLWFEPEAFDEAMALGHKLWKRVYGLWYRVWELPSSPIRHWLIDRNANRMAKDLLKEFEKRE